MFTQRTDAVNDPIDNIKPFVLAAVALITFGGTSALWWARERNVVDSKAPQVQMDSLRYRVSDLERERVVFRILLCRMPEIRPDSHCEGYR
jgi:hypothetical protein